MAIIEPQSIVYQIVSGKHKGKTCVIRRAGSGNQVSVRVALIGDSNGRDRIVSVRRGELAQLETPGWPREIHGSLCGLQKDLSDQRGNGANTLRTPVLVQSQALEMSDVLATEEIVVDRPRRGYNSSVLIRLDQIGWVELAPRLPVALKGNLKFKFPVELKEHDRLATGRLVVRRPVSTKVDWTGIFLDRQNCRIDVPSCIPLALA